MRRRNPGDQDLRALERELRAAPTDSSVASRAAAAFQRTGRVADACLALRAAGLPWRELAWANDLQRGELRSTSKIAKDNAPNWYRYWGPDAMLGGHREAVQAHYRALQVAAERSDIESADVFVRGAGAHDSFCSIVFAETNDDDGNLVPEVWETLWADFELVAFPLVSRANPILQAFMRRWWGTEGGEWITQQRMLGDLLLDLAFALDAHMELGWPVRRAFAGND